MMVNPTLLKLAAWRIDQDRTMNKAAVVPAQVMDPAMAGGAPPPGGMPPGAPPMDPAMGGMPPPGGAPPVDPSMGMAPPPPPGGIDPAMIQQIVEQTMAASGGAPGAPGAAGKGTAKKVDPAIIDTKLWQIMRMVAEIMNHMQIPIPADVALGPPPEQGMLDAANMDQAGALPAEAGGGAPPGGDPAAQQSAIAPIDPMQPAMPTPPKQASFNVGSEYRTTTKTEDAKSSVAALAALSRKLNAT